MYCQDESYISNGIFVSPKLLQSMSPLCSKVGQSFQFSSAPEDTELGSTRKYTRTKDNLKYIEKRKLSVVNNLVFYRS